MPMVRRGRLVVSARMVRPMTSGGTPRVLPATVLHQIRRYKNIQIQMMLPTRLMGNSFLEDGFLVSGRVIQRGSLTGKRKM